MVQDKLYLQWSTDRKSYMIYRMVSLQWSKSTVTMLQKNRATLNAGYYYEPPYELELTVFKWHGASRGLCESWVSCIRISIDNCVSDNSEENSMVPVKSSVAEAETERRKSRGIWSLAEIAASSSGNTSTTTTNSSYFQFRPDASLISYLSNPAQHQRTPTPDDVIYSLPLISQSVIHKRLYTNNGTSIPWSLSKSTTT